MKIEPLVSVIVAVSTDEETIYGCIESIMEQSYHNLEIILVIDDSYDRINIICNNIALMDNRIRIINIDPDMKDNEASNISAFYEGLRHAAGSYAVFVDSGDRLHNDMIRILTGICVKHQCQIACCRTGMRKKSGSLRLSKRGSIRVYRKNAAFLSRKFTCELYGKIFNTALFEDEDLCRSDLCLYPLYYRAGKISVTEKIMYFRNDESFTLDDKQIRFDAVFNYYKERIRYFKKKDKNLSDLSHEYFCEFLADYYIYQLINREEAGSPEKTCAEFKREYGIVRYNAITPVITKLRLGFIYHIPKLYAVLIKIFRIRMDLIMAKNLKRL